jgi:hypothetical protein
MTLGKRTVPVTNNENIQSRFFGFKGQGSVANGTSTAFPRFQSYRHVVEPRPEERALARVSKDGHKRNRASGHPSRRRFAPPQDEVCGFKLHPPDPIGFMESID